MTKYFIKYKTYQPNRHIWQEHNYMIMEEIDDIGNTKIEELFVTGKKKIHNFDDITKHASNDSFRIVMIDDNVIDLSWIEKNDINKITKKLNNKNYTVKFDCHKCKKKIKTKQPNNQNYFTINSKMELLCTECGSVCPKCKKNVEILITNKEKLWIVCLECFSRKMDSLGYTLLNTKQDIETETYLLKEKNIMTFINENYKEKFVFFDGLNNKVVHIPREKGTHTAKRIEPIKTNWKISN